MREPLHPPTSVRILRYALVPFLALSATGLSCGGDPAVGPTPAPIVQYRIVYQRDNGGLTSRRRAVIRDADEWRELWEQVHRPQRPNVPQLPSVDFDSELIVLASAGALEVESTISIAKVAVHRIPVADEEEPREVMLVCVRTSEANAGVDAQVYPVVIARVSRIEGVEVEFDDVPNDERRECLE